MSNATKQCIDYLKEVIDRVKDEVPSNSLRSTYLETIKSVRTKALRRYVKDQSYKDDLLESICRDHAMCRVLGMLEAMVMVAQADMLQKTIRVEDNDEQSN